MAGGRHFHAAADSREVERMTKDRWQAAARAGGGVEWRAETDKAQKEAGGRETNQISSPDRHCGN